MRHDFIGNWSDRVPRFSSVSENCLDFFDDKGEIVDYKGYMSYDGDPKKWSPCSVEGFTTYFNGPDANP